MSEEPKPAARLNDYVAHDNSQWLKLLGWAFTTGAAGLAMKAASSMFKAPLLLAGPAGWAVFAGLTAVEWGVSKWLESYIDEESKKHADPGVPKVNQGCEQVFVQSLQWARANFDHVICQKHGFKLIKQGSEWVSINRQPAARWTDRTHCSGGATLTENPGLPPKTVYAGGPPSEYENKADLHKLLDLLWTIKGGSKGWADAFETGAGKLGSAGLDKVWDTVFK